ncbi:hypothetical protein AHAS_Ahas03G0138800 [Arachis hypogaea]
MDSLLILLFVWAWNRMSWIAPVPRVGFEFLFTVVVIFFPSDVLDFIHIQLVVNRVQEHMLFKLNVRRTLLGVATGQVFALPDPALPYNNPHRTRSASSRG